MIMGLWVQEWALLWECPAVRTLECMNGKYEGAHWVLSCTKKSVVVGQRDSGAYTVWVWQIWKV